MKINKPFHPYILLFIAILSVSISSIMIKSSDTPTSVAGMYRLYISVIIMLPFVPWKMLRSLEMNKKRLEYRFLSWSFSRIIFLILDGIFSIYLSCELHGHLIITAFICNDGFILYVQRTSKHINHSLFDRCSFRFNHYSLGRHWGFQRGINRRWVIFVRNNLGFSIYVGRTESKSQNRCKFI